jgi:hypothetical protein
MQHTATFVDHVRDLTILPTVEYTNNRVQSLSNSDP